MLATAQKYNYSQSLRLAVFLSALLVTCAAVWAVWSLDMKWTIFTLMGLAFPFVVVLVPDARRFMLGALMFVIPLNADRNLMMHPSPGGADAYTIGLTDVLLVILLAITVVRLAQSKKAGEIELFPAILVPSLAMLAFFFLSLVAAKDLMWSSFDIINFIKTILFFIVLANNIRDEKDLTIVLIAALAGLFVQSVIVGWQTMSPAASSILQKFGLGAPAELQHFEMQASDLSRPGGTIGHCNHFARYVGLLVPVAIVLALVQHKRMSLLFTVVAIAASVALVNTLTRSSWIGLVLSLMVMLPAMLRFRHISFRILGKLSVAAVIFLILMAFFFKPIWGRIVSDDKGSANTRITTAKVALEIIRDYPITGCGINNYGSLMGSYWNAEDSFTRYAAVHNTYLLYAAEIGVLGFAVYLWLLIAFFLRIRRAMRSRKPYFSTIAIGIWGGYIAFLATALTDKSFKENFTLLLVLWGLMAIVEAMNRMDNRYRSMFLG